jgi:hypothetical protein
MRHPVLAFVVLLGAAAVAEGATTCVFDVAGTTMRLTGDCTTDESIVIPDGLTLDGGRHTIVAVDPGGGHFKGGVVVNGGATASVVDLQITTSALTNVCDAGADRLRGILFDHASGRISRNVIEDINQGASGCQEGNAIEVRNFDAFNNPDTPIVSVEISHNRIERFQKTGIVVNGGVEASIHHNKVGGSATQANLAANGVQVGFGARADVQHNQVAGNSWCCADAAATAVLLFDAAAGTMVQHNNVDGNADVGIYAFADGVTVDNNRVFESGADGFYDIGVGSYGTGNTVTNNKVRGYDQPYDGVTGGKNKTIPGPNAD